METLKSHLAKSPENNLYHYTSIHGFLGIIEARELWASDVYYMNDTKELVYATELVKEVLTDKLINHQYHDVISKMFQGGIYNSQYANIFCVSFSEARDLLSQWRGYGGGCGMALCFEPEMLRLITDLNSTRLAKCVYDRETQLKIISEICEKHVQKVAQQLQANPKLDEKAAAEEFFHELCFVAPIIKHPSFKDENEWRMLSNVFDMVYSGNLPFDKMGYRAGKNTIIPYLKIKLEVEPQEENGDTRLDLGFHDILIGPSDVAELPWRAVWSILTANNIKYSQITPSSVPLRGSV